MTERVSKETKKDLQELGLTDYESRVYLAPNKRTLDDPSTRLCLSQGRLSGSK